MTDKKIINSKSEEAVRYRLDSVEGWPLKFDCTVTHKVLYCLKCGKQFEYVSQISLEDFFLILEKTHQRMGKKAEISYQIIYVDKDGRQNSEMIDIDKIDHIRVVVLKNDMKVGETDVLIKRKTAFDMPYYLDLKYFKRRLKELIKTKR